jgi:hypothetical protein
MKSIFPSIKIIQAAFFTVGAACMLTGCGNRLPSLEEKIDIVYEVQAQLQEETQEIDFRRESIVSGHLFSGWSFPQALFTWADSKESRVLFNDFNDPNDITIAVDCRPAPPAALKTQRTVLGLNKEKISSFNILPGPIRTYNLTLPAAMLTFGANMLHFRFAYQTRPHDINPERKDRRSLAAAFQKICFDRKVKDGNEKGIIQVPDSSFSYISRISKKCRLRAVYHNLRGTQSRIEVLGPKGEIHKSYSLNPEKNEFDRIIKVKKPQLYTIRFVTEGRGDSMTVWPEIFLEKPAPENNKGINLRKFSRAPDIFLYVVDTLRADHVSCYGYEKKTTPHLDAFAEKNALYLNAFSNASWTRPSAACILTGLYPKNHKTQLYGHSLPKDAVTLAEVLESRNYHNIAFVANASIGKVFGFNQGFHEYRELTDIVPRSKHIQSDTVNQHVFTFLEDYIQRPDRKPLFAVIWTMDPHGPYAPDTDVENMFSIDEHQCIDTFDTNLLPGIRTGRVQPTASQIDFMRTRYDQEIYFNDRSFGLFLEKLKELNLYRDSSIIFTSDHGEEFMDHGSIDHGRSLYKEMVHIPFAIKADGLSAGIHHERIQLTDVFPTILNLAGSPVPDKINGISLFSLDDPLRTLFFEERNDKLDLTAVLDEEKKVIYNKVPDRRPSREYIPLFEIFDLADQREQHAFPPAGIDDLYRIQQIFSYRHSKDLAGWKEREIEIPPEVEEKLKALGYIK